jgi:hypothetical protein
VWRANVSLPPNACLILCGAPKFRRWRLRRVSKRALSDHIQGIRTYLECVSSRLGLEKESEQGVVALCLILEVNQPFRLGVPAPWSLNGSPASYRPSDLV